MQLMVYDSDANSYTLYFVRNYICTLTKHCCDRALSCGELLVQVFFGTNDSACHID